MKKQVKIKLTSREVEALKQILWDFNYHEEEQLRDYKSNYAIDEDELNPFYDLNEIQKFDNMVIHYHQRRLEYGKDLLEHLEKLEVNSEVEVVKDFCL